MSAYYPSGGRYALVAPKKSRLVVDGQPVAELPQSAVTGKSVTIELEASQIADRPGFMVRYTLTDDAEHLLVEAVYRNPLDKPVSDAIRADRTFTFAFDTARGCFAADDEWFRHAYGVARC